MIRQLTKLFGKRSNAKTQKTLNFTDRRTDRQTQRVVESRARPCLRMIMIAAKLWGMIVGLVLAFIVARIVENEMLIGVVIQQRIVMVERLRKVLSGFI